MNSQDPFTSEGIRENMRVIRFSVEILECEDNQVFWGNPTGLTLIRERSEGSEAEMQKLLFLSSSGSELEGRGARTVNKYHDSCEGAKGDGRWQMKCLAFYTNRVYLTQ